MDRPELAHIYIAIAGEAQQGSGGVTLIDAVESRTSYVSVSKIRPLSFSTKLSSMVEEDGCDFLYFVVRAKESLHVMKFPRSEVHKIDWSSVRRDVVSSAAGVSGRE